MDREQWLEERRLAGVGGSEAPVVVGVSPWKTPYALYQQKRGEVVDQTVDNWSMMWGRTIEPMLRQYYSDMTGKEVMLAPSIVRHPRNNFMFCTPDGFTDERRLLEIKTSRSMHGWGEPGTDQIPQPYLIQVQHSLCVMEHEVCDVLLGLYGQQPLLYHVEADLELQELITDAEREFWQCVQDGNPPEPSSYADVIARWGRRSIADAVTATPAVEFAVKDLQGVRLAMASLEESEEKLKTEILKHLAEHDTLVDPAGTVLCTWKAAKASSRFDAIAFKQANPDLYQKFLKLGDPTRRFLLPKGPSNAE